METLEHGDMESWSHGVMESWSHGAMEPWSHGAMEPWSHGAMETWRHGDMETWRHGDMETWRHNMEKTETEALAIILIPCTVCSACKWKFVVCQFVNEETNGNHLFANGLIRLNGLAHLW
jgi:hypothetical protein